MDACRENGIATTIKHFPGDGVDYRDQHLMASVNSLSAEEWYASYGKVYKTLIDYGAPTLMSAHIPVSYTHLDVYKRQGILPGRLRRLRLFLGQRPRRRGRLGRLLRLHRRRGPADRLFSQLHGQHHEADGGLF